MNHFFYGFEAREKLRDLRNEGMRGQAFARSDVQRKRVVGFLRRLAVIATALLALILIAGR